MEPLYPSHGAGGFFHVLVVGSFVGKGHHLGGEEKPWEQHCEEVWGKAMIGNGSRGQVQSSMCLELSSIKVAPTAKCFL